MQGSETMLLASFSWDVPVYLAAGIALGWWFCAWKWKSRRNDLVLAEKSVLDAARREADAVQREARIAANEEALRLRERTEAALASRRREIDELDGRLSE